MQIYLHLKRTKGFIPTDSFVMQTLLYTFISFTNAKKMKFVLSSPFITYQAHPPWDGEVFDNAQCQFLEVVCA